MIRKTHTCRNSSSSWLAVSLAARIAAAGVTLALLGTACSAGTDSSLEVVANDGPAASTDRIVHMFDGWIENLDLDTIAMEVRQLPLDKVSFRSPYCRPDEDCGPYIVELRDAAGAKVAEVPLEVSEYHWDGTDRDGRGTGGHTTTLESYIIDPPDYASFAVLMHGEELLVVERSAHAPTAELSGITEGQFFTDDEPLMFSLSVDDKDGDKLKYKVFWKCDSDTCEGDVYESYMLGWLRRFPSDTFSVTEDLSTHVPKTDNAQIAVAVFDGTRSVFVESPTFKVGDHAPVVNINTPKERVHLTVTGQEEQWVEESDFADDEWNEICRWVLTFSCIHLTALGYDTDESNFGYQEDAYSWSSDVNGHLGTGRSLLVPAHELSLGEHIFTVTWTNDQGISATDTLEVFVEQVSEEAG